MSGFLKQSTASQTRILGAFIDDTDFKTAETGLTIANTDIKLSKNGGTVANKNSGGGTHISNGNYAVTFDATDTATVGELQVSVKMSGALQVFDKFFVVEENVYDALYGASAALGTDLASVLEDTSTTLPESIGAIGSGSSSAFNFPVTADNTGGAIIDSVTFVGTQTGTYANVENDISTFHQIDDDTNAIDLVYRIPCGAIRTATSATVRGYLNGGNDELNIQAYDHVGSDWETVKVVSGQNGSTVNDFDIILFEKHTGAQGSAEAGNVYLRFVCSGQSNPVLFIAQVFVSAVTATSSMGYENGMVWVDEDNGNSTGTTQGIDAIFTNQSDDFDNAQDIADTLGTSIIHLHPGNSITLSDSLEGYIVEMTQATVTGGSQDVGGTRFNEGVFQGTFTRTSGFPSFADGRIFGISSVVFPQFVAFRCSVVGTLTLSEAANQTMIDCQAGGTATIDCASLGSGFILNLVRWTGNLTLNNLAASAVVNLWGDGCGELTLNGADATVNLGGVIESVVNNLTGSPTVTNNALTLAKINAEADTALSDYDSPTKAELDSGFAALNDLSAAAVNAEVDTALTDYDPPTQTELLAAHSTTDGLITTVDTVVDAIKVITDLIGSTGATRLSLSAGQIIPGTVDTATNTHTPTTTEFQADDITEATADHYNGRIIIFTSGVLAGQATSISDYAAVGGIGQFTVVALTEAPSNNDTFIIL